MIHIFVWPLLVLAFVTKKQGLKTLGFTAAVIASVLAVFAAAESAYVVLIGLVFYWLFAWLLALAIRFFLNRKNKGERDEEKTHQIWLTAVALGIGYIIGYLGIEKQPTFPPREGIHWLFYFALFALFSSTYWNASRWWRLVSQIIYSVALPRILLNPYFQHTWGTVEGIIWWVGLSAGIFVFWNIVEQSFSAIPSKAAIPFVYFGLSGGTALIIALSGSLRIAQHAGILTALFATIWILTLVLQRKKKTDPSSNQHVFSISVSPVVTFLFIGIWLNGYFYAEVPSASVILLAVSPFLAQVGQIQTIQKLENRKSIFVQVGLIALCVSIAVIIAVVRSGFFGGDAY